MRPASDERQRSLGTNMRQLNDERRIALLRTNGRRSPTAAGDNSLAVLGPRSQERLRNVTPPGVAGVGSPPRRPRTASSILPVLEQNREDETEESCFSTRRADAQRNLSDRDRSALKLGRLLMSNLLEKPEVSTTDSLSRFFFDNWLARSNSSLADADTFSIDKLSGLQRDIDRINAAALVSEEVLWDGSEAQGEGELGSPTVSEVRARKEIACVSLATLDNVITEFGRGNPVLVDIREALLPMLFAEKGTEGEKYMECRTWSENAFDLQNKLRETERARQQEFSRARLLNEQRESEIQRLKLLEPLQQQCLDLEALLQGARRDVMALTMEKQGMTEQQQRWQRETQAAEEENEAHKKLLSVKQASISLLEDTIKDMEKSKLPDIRNELSAALADREAARVEIDNRDLALRHMKSMLETYQSVEMESRQKVSAMRKTFSLPSRHYLADVTGCLSANVEHMRTFLTENEHASLTSIYERQIASQYAQLERCNVKFGDLQICLESEKEKRRERELEVAAEKALAKDEHDRAMNAQQQEFAVERAALNDVTARLEADLVVANAKIEETTSELRGAQDRLRESQAVAADAVESARQSAEGRALALNQLSSAREEISQVQGELDTTKQSMLQIVNEHGFLLQDVMLEEVLLLIRTTLAQAEAAGVADRAEISHLSGQVATLRQEIAALEKCKSQFNKQLETLATERLREKEDYENRLSVLGSDRLKEKEALEKRILVLNSEKANLEASGREMHSMMLSEKAEKDQKDSALIEMTRIAGEHEERADASDALSSWLCAEAASILAFSPGAPAVCTTLDEVHSKLHSSVLPVVSKWLEARPEKLSAACQLVLECQNVGSQHMSNMAELEEYKLKLSQSLAKVPIEVPGDSASIDVEAVDDSRGEVEPHSPDLEPYRAPAVDVAPLLDQIREQNETIELLQKNALRDEADLAKVQQEISDLKIALERAALASPSPPSPSLQPAATAAAVLEEEIPATPAVDGDGMQFSELAKRGVNAKRMVQPFMKVIRRNENLLSKEAAQLSIALSEAKGLCERIDLSLAEIQKAELHYYRRMTPGSGMSDDPTNAVALESIWASLRSVRLEIASNAKWLFDLNSYLKPTGQNKNDQNKNDLPAGAFSEARMAGLYEDLSEDLRMDMVQTCNDLVSSLRDRSAMDGGWRSVIYRADGTMDLDSVPLFMYSDAEKVDILQEQIKYLKVQHEAKKEALVNLVEKHKAGRAMADHECDALREAMDMLRKEYGEVGLEHDFAIYTKIKRGILDGSIPPLDRILNPGDFAELEWASICCINTLSDLCSPVEVAAAALNGFSSLPDEKSLAEFYRGLNFSASEGHTSTQQLAIKDASPSRPGSRAAPAKSSLAASPLLPLSLSAGKSRGKQSPVPQNDWKSLQKQGRQKQAIALLDMKQTNKAPQQVKLQLPVSPSPQMDDETIKDVAPNTENPPQTPWSSEKTTYLASRMRMACESTEQRILFAAARASEEWGPPGMSIGERFLENNSAMIQMQQNSSSFLAGCYDDLNASIAYTAKKSECDSELYARNLNARINKCLQSAREMQEQLSKLTPIMSAMEVIKLKKNYSQSRVLAPVSFPQSPASADNNFPPSTAARCFSSPQRIERLGGEGTRCFSKKIDLVPSMISTYAPVQNSAPAIGASRIIPGNALEMMDSFSDHGFDDMDHGEGENAVGLEKEADNDAKVEFNQRDEDTPEREERDDEGRVDDSLQYTDEPSGRLLPPLTPKTPPAVVIFK